MNFDYSSLRSHAPEEFLPYLDMLEAGSSKCATATHFGKHHSYVCRMVERLRAAHVNYASADARDGTDPYVLNAVTTAVAGGKIERQWLKTKLSDVLYLKNIREGISAFMQDLPTLPVVAAPLDYQSDIIPWINIGDGHLNMLASMAISGTNFDLETAEIEIMAGAFQLIDELPDCERIVINDLGDFTHAENIQGKTEGHGHDLDTDQSYPNMIRVYSRLMRALVDRALTKANTVDVIVNQGNHSRKNDMWMRELLEVAYGHSNRVNILNNDSVFIGYRMGNTLVITHHSDKCKPKRLADVMTTDFRTDFGETEHHYIWIGHVHHSMVVKEHPSIFIESFNHLAALDQFAYEGGWRNRRSITVVHLSRRYGEVKRRILPIQEIYDKIRGLTHSGKAQESRRAFAA